jgi:glycerol-3-phosphate dehydrogenase
MLHAGPAARHESLQALAAEPFELLVIGGGITGAGIAREAALAGVRTALVERQDFAAGTSSRSTRLVHGGVRYLEHGHLRLVFESSRERRLLLTLAPHLVRPLPFIWPVYRGARVPLWKVRAGLTLYDALALFRNVGRHTVLSRDAVLLRESALQREGLVGGARYWDAATDDTRLTLANAIAAREAGAVVVNYAAVTGARRQGTQLDGVLLRDELSGATLDVRVRTIINATGPWSDATAALTADPSAEAGDRMPHVLGSAGAHIAVPRQRLGNHEAITIVSPVDGRVMFVIPAGVHAIIGTTERPAKRSADAIRATQADVSYLLTSVNRCFPYADLRPDDVISAWCGIRPLAVARAGEQNAGSASREHAVTRRADGLVSVTGGKLTTYRAMAADVLHKLLSITASASERTPLPGGDLTTLESTVQDAARTTHDQAVGERLAHAYGSRWRNVWSYVQRDATMGERLAEPLPYLMAEVVHAADRESACTLGDVLIRRTHVAFETRDHGRGAAARIAPVLQHTLSWSDAERDAQIARYEAEVTRLFSIDDR